MQNRVRWKKLLQAFHSELVPKYSYIIEKTELENKIPDTRLANKTDYNDKIAEIENKIPSISGLATNAALTWIENKTPNISSLVKKNRL